MQTKCVQCCLFQIQHVFASTVDTAWKEVVNVFVPQDLQAKGVNRKFVVHSHAQMVELVSLLVEAIPATVQSGILEATAR